MGQRSSREEAAFHKGQAAYCAGKGEKRPPYAYDSPEWRAWLVGWADAQSVDSMAATAATAASEPQSRLSEATDCDGTPLEVGTLDPGIRGLVVALLEAGFETCDSGDGSYKATTGEYEEGTYGNVPHVVVRYDGGDLRTLGYRLLEFVVGLHELHDREQEFQVDAGFFLDADGACACILSVVGDSLYALTGTQPDLPPARLQDDELHLTALLRTEEDARHRLKDALKRIRQLEQESATLRGEVLP